LKAEGKPLLDSLLHAVSRANRSLFMLVYDERRPNAAQLWLKPPEELLNTLRGRLHACQGTSRNSTLEEMTAWPLR
jgi:hypothetical protein